MLMRFDPFRDVDRVTEATLERASVPTMPTPTPARGQPIAAAATANA